MTKKRLSILCFGDSLTEGYSQYGTKFTPYGDTLKSFLDEQLGDGDGDGDISVRIEGVSGELVCASMERRMLKLYETRDGDEKFDWLVFLGGTNDLGWGRPAQEIWDAIVAVTEVARQRDGVKVLLCTVPECAVRNERLDARRGEVNARIRGDEREGVYIFDLHKRIPYHDIDEEERKAIWDDGLHFTEEGYERIGLIVGRRLLGIIAYGEGREDVEVQ